MDYIFGKYNMKKPLFYLFLFINICFIVNVSFSTNYYIDAISGSDNNNGTSPTLAWKTIDKVNSIIFQPGDSILFHRDQSWTGNIFIDYTGNQNQPIVFSSYGEGDYPILKGSYEADSTNYWVHTGNDVWESSITYNEEVSVLFYNTNDSLPLRANKKGTLGSLYDLWDFYYNAITHKVSIYSPAGNPADQSEGIEIVQYNSGIHVEDVCNNITISELKLLYYANDGIYAWNPGPGLIIDNTIIANIGGPASDMFHGNGIFIHFLYSNDTITIINNETYNIWNIGIFVPAGPTTKSTLYGSRICNNKLVMTGASAIGLRYAIGVEISDNYIHKASVYIPDRVGIGLENCDYLIVNSNTISEAVDDFSSTYSGWLSAGIYTFGVNHSKIFYNIVSQGMVGIHLDDDSGTYGYSSVGNEICYNLCYDFIGIGIMVEQENDSTLVYNNTTFNCLYAGISFRGWASGNSDYCSVKNNIVCNQVFTNNVIEIANIGIDFQMDHNCFYHFDPSANLVHWLGNDYTAAEFGNYQIFSGQDSNSITNNPLFLNIDSVDFSLSSFSPCIDAGTNLGLDQDLIGQPVPSGGIVDIGAFEFKDTLFHIESFHTSETLSIQVYPNPFGDKVNYHINSSTFEKINYTISNNTGQTIYSGQERIQPGNSTFEIDLSGVPPGIYFTKIITEGENQVIKKLIKL